MLADSRQETDQWSEMAVVSGRAKSSKDNIVVEDEKMRDFQFMQQYEEQDRLIAEGIG